MQQLLYYLEDTWIGKLERRTRNWPTFSYPIWNCFQNITDNIPLTNNSVEGWNRGFLSQIKGEKPSIWNFLEALKKKQTKKIVKEQSVNKMPKRKYDNLNEKQKNICSEFDNAFSNDEIIE